MVFLPTRSTRRAITWQLLALPTIFALLGTSPVIQAASTEADSEAARHFEEKVRPLLAAKCFSCHGPDKDKGGLRLDSRTAMLHGGESGDPAIVPGKPGESVLIEAIKYESYEMPPSGMMSAEEIAVLSTWVKNGAIWPGSENESGEIAKKEPKITEEDRAFWSFQPLSDPTPPRIEDDEWSRNPIDKFVLRRLKQEGLRPANRADRLTLLRRASFDLLGLPPTQEEIDAFLSDKAPDAYERLIERLLARPEYGERWARHWLDLVRYAESDGYRADGYRPTAWRYRDYVINAFNEDKPYDQFVKEQLAGDEIAPNDPDALAATGYLRHWSYEYNQRDVRTQWDYILNDVTDVTSDVFLGLGMACARCHDHKYDPILQDDYFRLQAFFAPILPREDIPFATPEQRAEHAKALAKWEKETAEIRAEIDELRKKGVEGAVRRAREMFPEDIQKLMLARPEEITPLERQLAALANRQVEDARKKKVNVAKDKKERYEQLTKKLKSMKKPTLPTGLTVTDIGSEAPKTIIPGDRKKRVIAPGFLTIFDPNPAVIETSPVPNSTGRRTTLARWITQEDHPLTSRVMVNRIWQHHFGRGLVSTPSDFGRLGEKPTHPELLDWLARRFVEEGWSIKNVHRLIMNSASYRQAALVPATQVAKEKDPSNNLLWRANIRRLDAEQARDAMLVASGELDEKRRGGASLSANSPVRSVYTKRYRNRPDPLLGSFDAPNGFASCSRRNVTTTATQALLMINGSWPLQRASAMAKRLEKLGVSDREMIETAYEWAYSRKPEHEELERTLAFLERQAGLKPERKETQLKTIVHSKTDKEGRSALYVREGDVQDRLQVPFSESLPSEDFTIEAIVQLRSLYPSANVRVIASQWDGNHQHPGWSFGVTSEKSAYKPRNLILQLIGDRGKGKPEYEVIASGLRVPLNKPVYVAASLKLKETGKLGVTFYMMDLSKPDAVLHAANTPHLVRKDYRPKGLPFFIGGRHHQSGQGWDGLIDEVRLSDVALTPEQLLVQNSSDRASTVGRWRFESDPGVYADSSKQHNNMEPTRFGANSSERMMALTDFCHSLLNSNEFLYVD
ncbi:Planctomycete cytochrome C [Planctomycetes bacterium Pan216]|uniref:Planctomycete cytochrome C n=1 Tax=Kolteria novifilia TaxID=2527975 RepID=A0A518B580_9BACT|nr:Planctomycete cytochrome C [Planctomycetes bacterium Pan216]